MKGNNKLEINQATMVEAIQLWINSTMIPPPKVEAVNEARGVCGGAFEIQLSEPHTEKP